MAWFFYNANEIQVKEKKKIGRKKGQTDLLHLPVVKVGKQYKKI